MPNPAPAGYNRLLNIPNSRHLRLEALPIEEALTLASRRLEVAALPKPAAALIEERAEGHPLYSEELAYALRDAGLIDIRNGRCRVAAGAKELRNLDFPDTLPGVIASRIDCLPPPQQLTLKVAGVIGRIFTLRVLRDIHPVKDDKPRLQEYLDTLDRLDLTPLKTPEPDLSYTFKHVITQEAAYNLMALARRQKLHRAIAGRLEQNYADNLSFYYPLLAHHWRNALKNQPADSLLVSKAIDYLEKAGEQALDNFANPEAITFFNELAALNNNPENTVARARRARWNRLLGEAYLGLGDWEDSSAHYKRALALLGRPVAAGQSGLILSLLAQTLQQALYRMWPIKTNSKREKNDALREAARAYGQLARINFLAGKRLPYLNAGLIFANLAERIGPSPELARGYAHLCLVTGNIPLHSAAKAYGRRALKTAEGINDLSTTALVVKFTGYYNLGAGRWTRAQNLLGRGAEICSRLGDRRNWEQIWGLLALLAYHQGNFARGKKLFAEVFASANRRSDAQPQIWGLLGQIENELWLSSTVTDSVKQCLETAESLLTEKNLSSAESIRIFGLMGQVYLRQGKQQLALQAVQKALQLSAQSPFTLLYAFDGYAGPAEVYLLLWEIHSSQLPGEYKALSKVARQACQGLRRFARVFPIAQPRAWLHRGRYSWLAGKQQKARKAWQKSLALAQQLQMPHEEGLAHYEIGRRSEGEIRQKHLNRAIEIFEQLGANYNLGRARRELNR